MDIVETLSNLKNIEIFCNTFTKSSASDLSIARNIVSKSISISGGANTVGHGSQYNQPYSVLCQNASLTNTKIYNGNVIYTNSLITVMYENIDFSDIKNTNAFDFDSMRSQLLAYSAILRTNTNNVTKRYSAGIYTFTCGNDVNYITMDTVEIGKYNTATTLKFNCKKNSIIIFNFIGTSPVYHNAPLVEFIGDNINESNIIYNFEDNAVNITGHFSGSIINAGAVTLTNATQYGSIYCNSIAHSGTNYYMDTVLSIIDTLPINKLTAPVVNLTATTLPNGITVDITNSELNPNALIEYSIDNVPYTTYNEPFTYLTVGNHTLKVYVVELGNISTEVVDYEFTITCECENPIIDYANNVITITSNISTSKIHYRLDGVEPTTGDNYIASGGQVLIPNDGYYEVVAVAYDDICAKSGTSRLSVSIEYPEDTISINILSPDNGSGIYVDQNGQGVLVQITNSGPNAIKYTLDGSDPKVNGITYSGPFYTKSNKIIAITYAPYAGYSNYFTKSFIIGGSFYIDKSTSKEKSINKLDRIASTATFAEDIGWIGPTIIVDDTSLYQALVNILSTPLLEIPFNPSFGISLQHKLFEVTGDLSSDAIISNLKNEIEYNDPRIEIMKDTSYAYVMPDINKLVIELDWRNRYSGEIAHVRYGYDLDGLLQ